MKKDIKFKSILVIFSIVLGFAITELVLRVLNIPPFLDKEFQRIDIAWMEKNVVLNSAGYRDREYPFERSADTFRILALGDSYTYGWLVNNPEDTYPKIIEKKLNAEGEKIEVINAGSPGFSLPEMVRRFISDGKYYSPNLVMIGINDDEANFTKTYVAPYDSKLNKSIKSSHLYQITLGNYFRYRAEKINHDYVLRIYTDQNSKEWERFSEQILILKKEAEKINSKLAIILFPHIHPNRPNDKYDYYPFNEKLKQFGKENDIFIVDPLEVFLKYREKSELVINPLDPHPTVKMNEIVANVFLKKFDLKNYLFSLEPYTPTTKTVILNKYNSQIGKFDLIKNISSNIPDLPWVYFETKYETSSQDFPLKNTSFRNTKIYIDILKTAKSFTHSGLPGATISYHIYPGEKGKIIIPKTIYGYDVVGINHIFALSIGDDGTISSDYISPESIIQDSRGFKINFVPQKNYHNYRVSLSVATRQMDINPEGSIEHTITTEVLTKKAEEETQTIFFPVSKRISSWQVFSEEPGENHAVALVDGKITKVSAIKTADNGITLKFLFKIKAGQEVKFAIAREYDLVDDLVKIEFE